MAKMRLVTTLALFATFSLGCGALKELVEGQQTPAPEPTPEPAPVAPEAPPAAAPWRVLLVLDRTADHSFESHSAALESALTGSDVQLVQVTDSNPVELKGTDGAVRGRLEISTITDAETGYIFAEENRPPTYLAPAGLPIVLQQASAYFKTTFARPDLGGGAMGDGKVGKMGKAGKAGKVGHPMSPEMMKGSKVRARERAGTPVAPTGTSGGTSGQ